MNAKTLTGGAAALTAYVAVVATVTVLLAGSPSAATTASPVPTTTRTVFAQPTHQASPAATHSPTPSATPTRTTTHTHPASPLTPKPTTVHPASEAPTHSTSTKTARATSHPSARSVVVHHPAVTHRTATNAGWVNGLCPRVGYIFPGCRSRLASHPADRRPERQLRLHHLGRRHDRSARTALRPPGSMRPREQPRTRVFTVAGPPDSGQRLPSKPPRCQYLDVQLPAHAHRGLRPELGGLHGFRRRVPCPDRHRLVRHRRPRKRDPRRH